MPKWLTDAVFYEIYPQSFYDTNADGIGDFNGIIEKLDYIKGLGCNALFLENQGYYMGNGRRSFRKVSHFTKYSPGRGL